MPQKSIFSNNRLINVFGIFLTGMISLVIATLSGGVTFQNLQIPFGYSDDAIWTNTYIKTIIEQGWFFTNPRLGAPYGYQIYDFPNADGLHSLLIWVFSNISKLWVQSSWIWVLNTYSLFTFPLTAWTTFYALRSSRVSLLPSISASVLFALIPYHWQRLGGHLFLASYYMIPCSVLVLLETVRSPSNHKPRNQIIAFLTGCAGVYYAFFFCFFLVLTVFISSARKRFRVLKAVTSVILATMVGISLNIGPSLYYWNQHGKNPSILVRSKTDAETYGLKITQMILPVDGHRSELLHRIKDKYNESIQINETFTSSLGLIGSFGFILLVGFALFGRNRNNRIHSLAVFNLAAVLLATIGGISSLLALAKFTQIRSYNRISIYIAYFSLAGIFMIISAKKWKQPKIIPFLVALLLVFGIWDQSPPGLARPFEKNHATLQSDRDFFEAVEAKVPPSSMILQLPFVSFPEQGYDGFRGYLHTKKLRWSFGATKGRTESLSIEAISSLPPKTLTSLLPGLGFSGILVDLNSEQGKIINRELEELIPLSSRNTSTDNRYSFYVLPTDPAQKVFQSRIDISGSMFEPNADLKKRISNLNIAANKYTKTSGSVDDISPEPSGGWHQNQYLILRGWAVDTAKQYAIKDLVVQEGNRLLPLKVFNVSRPDVANYLANPSLVNAGWVAILPLNQFESGAHEVDVRALGKNNELLVIDKSTIRFLIRN